jgi:hypothetical protein
MLSRLSISWTEDKQNGLSSYPTIKGMEGMLDWRMLL